VVSTTDITGLTLGGGCGRPLGKYGLAGDNLLSADVVTADGRVAAGSTAEKPDRKRLAVTRCAPAGEHPVTGR
jgi:FAD/FMN-containing dehydrogenase